MEEVSSQLESKEPKERGFSKVVKSMKPTIWVLYFVEIDKMGNDECSILTGFTITKEGLVMTCAHGWDSCKDSDDDGSDDDGYVRRIVFGKRLNDIEYRKELEIVKINKSWDIMLLKEKKKSSKLRDYVHGTFALDGSLEIGETVCAIGNPGDYLGSCLSGSVAYPCVENVMLPTGKDTCDNFDHNLLKNTQGYMVTGHYYNAEYFKEYKGDVGLVKWEKFTDPYVPIIQINGMRGGGGASGSPIFNYKGEIVGMLISKVGGFNICVHVTLLRHFYDEYLQVSLNEETITK